MAEIEGEEFKYFIDPAGAVSMGNYIPSDCREIEPIVTSGASGTWDFKIVNDPYSKKVCVTNKLEKESEMDAVNAKMVLKRKTGDVVALNAQRSIAMTVNDINGEMVECVWICPVAGTVNLASFKAKVLICQIDGDIIPYVDDPDA